MKRFPNLQQRSREQKRERRDELESRGGFKIVNLSCHELGWLNGAACFLGKTLLFEEILRMYLVVARSLASNFS